MIEEGYAAVTTRRVATQAGVKPALVQYYFRTMDDLLLAVYQRAASAVVERQAHALASERPLHALWALNAEHERTSLAIEFMALANHRKMIKAEITLYNEQARKDQAKALAKILDGKIDHPRRYSPTVVSLLLACLARGLIMEEGMGIHTGHAELRGVVDFWLTQLEPKQRRTPRQGEGPS